MASIFTRIINGEIPGRIIWRDDTCVAMIDIRPLNRGHVLVIPVTEVDQWTDLPAEVVTHCTGVAHAVGRAQMAVLSPARIGLMVAGFEVPTPICTSSPWRAWATWTSPKQTLTPTPPTWTPWPTCSATPCEPGGTQKQPKRATNRDQAPGRRIQRLTPSRPIRFRKSIRISRLSNSLPSAWVHPIDSSSRTTASKRSSQSKPGSDP
ncbi:MAG: hypothetical protein Ct9H300mP12_00220 [Acidimicrobiales bacterium]|nr:MAG: hypothetical protein Ct9H300mP12_00220 [Acidimicrobiales bacterium]